MSSLWTPGGEIPVERDRPASEPSSGPPSGPPPEAPEPALGGADAAEQEAAFEQMRRQLVEAPAADVIAQHVMALYELAAIHLGEQEPRLDDVRLAIDAVEAVLQGLSGRLGPAEAAIASALPQLKMAFVEAKDRRDAGAAADG